jgi:hypothetical protein
MVAPAAADAKTGILCAKKAGDTKRVFVSKPEGCVSLGPRDSFSQAVWLRNIKWSRWGKKTAYGSATERGYREKAQSIPVKLRAFRLRTCPNGDKIYTRLNARSSIGTTQVRFTASCHD